MDDDFFGTDYLFNQPGADKPEGNQFGEYPSRPIMGAPKTSGDPYSEFGPSPIRGEPKPAPVQPGGVKPPPQPFTQADSITLQKYQQALAAAQRQVDDGTLSDQDGEGLKAQILQRMAPLQMRQKQTQQQQMTDQAQTLQQQSALSEAIAHSNAVFRAQGVHDRVSVYTDPMSGKRAHLYESAPNKWEQIDFGDEGESKAFESKSSDYFAPPWMQLAQGQTGGAGPAQDDMGGDVGRGAVGGARAARAVLADYGVGEAGFGDDDMLNFHGGMGEGLQEKGDAIDQEWAKLTGATEGVDQGHTVDQPGAAEGEEARQQRFADAKAAEGGALAEKKAAAGQNVISGSQNIAPAQPRGEPNPNQPPWARAMDRADAYNKERQLRQTNQLRAAVGLPPIGQPKGQPGGGDQGGEAPGGLNHAQMRELYNAADRAIPRINVPQGPMTHGQAQAYRHALAERQQAVTQLANHFVVKTINEGNTKVATEHRAQEEASLNKQKLAQDFSRQQAEDKRKSDAAKAEDKKAADDEKAKAAKERAAQTQARHKDDSDVLDKYVTEQRKVIHGARKHGQEKEGYGPQKDPKSGKETEGKPWPPEMETHEAMEDTATQRGIAHFKKMKGRLPSGWEEQDGKFTRIDTESEVKIGGEEGAIAYKPGAAVPAQPIDPKMMEVYRVNYLGKRHDKREDYLKTIPPAAAQAIRDSVKQDAKKKDEQSGRSDEDVAGRMRS